MAEGHVFCDFRRWVAEKEMTTHSSIVAWEIPRTEEPGGATVHGGRKEPDMT